jgi:hypothetical protein
MLDMGNELSDLGSGGDIPFEENDCTGLEFLKVLFRFTVKLFAGNANH